MGIAAYNFFNFSTSNVPKLPLEDHPKLPAYQPKLPPELNHPKNYQSRKVDILQNTPLAMSLQNTYSLTV
jgi:hypothetical protein